MITYKDHPILTLVTEALQYQALDEFAQSVVDELGTSEAFAIEQKLGIQIVTDRLVREGRTPLYILDYIANGDWTTGSVSVSALNSAQREGVIGAVVTKAKAVLAAKGTDLSALADATYMIPEAA